jgi:hypothetical protein
VEEMETAAGNFNKKIGKLGRDIKHWKVGYLSFISEATRAAYSIA